MQQSPPLVSYVVTGIVFAAVLYFRLRRMRGTRPLKIGTMWIVPLVFLVLAAMTLVQAPPHGLGWLAIAGALVSGSLIGWHRGRAMRITVDPETHSLSQSASPLAIILLLIIVAIRMGIRSIAELEHVSQGQLMLITDSLVVFALGLFSVQRLEMFQRAQRLLRDARMASQQA
jgi:hypothetical protein